jgi:hypothetical protein
MHWLSIMPVTHALKPTFQNKLSHFFGYSSRLEKLDCNQPAKLQLGRTATNQQNFNRAKPVGLEALVINQRTTNRAGRGASQPLSKASTSYGRVCN